MAVWQFLVLLEKLAIGYSTRLIEVCHCWVAVIATTCGGRACNLQRVAFLGLVLCGRVCMLLSRSDDDCRCRLVTQLAHVMKVYGATVSQTFAVGVRVGVPQRESAWWTSLDV